MTTGVFLIVLVMLLPVSMALHHFEEKCQEAHIEGDDVRNCIITSLANVKLRVLKKDITVSNLYPGLYTTLPLDHCDLSACVPGGDQECNYICPNDPNNDAIMAEDDPSLTEFNSSTTTETNNYTSAVTNNYTSAVTNEYTSAVTEYPTTPLVLGGTNQTVHGPLKRDTVVHRHVVKRKSNHQSQIEERYLWTCDFPNSGCCKSCRRLAPVFLRIESGRGWVYPVFCIREGGYQLTEQVACLKNGCRKKCEIKKVLTKLLVTSEPPDGWDGHCDKPYIPVWFKTIEMNSHCTCPPGGNPWSAPNAD